MEELVKTVNDLKKFLKDEQGAELAEYAVAIALLVAIAALVYAVLGNAINDSNTGVAADISGTGWSAP
jgi:Flp pilus assembly pilin Flp